MSVADCPLQMVCEFAETAGAGLTVTATVAVVVAHPEEDPVTV